MESLVGIRFKPTDKEIIHLLKKKRREPDFSVHTIKEIDIYKFKPWELPGFSAIQSKEEVWYFFCEPYYLCDKKKRSRRKTNTRYWKVTGSGSQIKAKNSSKVIGTKKILPFQSIASKKAKTKWVMHEIAVEDDSLYKKDYVVCRLERKRVTKRGISNSDDDQSSQDLTSCSNIDVSEGFSAIQSKEEVWYFHPVVLDQNLFCNFVIIGSSRNRRPTKTTCPRIILFQKPKSVFAISLRSQSKGCWSSWGLRYNERLWIKEISGTVTLPGSKSLSNRILLLGALSEGTTVVDNLLSSDDIHHMLDALKKLGLNVEDDSAKKQAVVEGCGGLFPVAKESTGDIELFLGNAGTAMRPLTAAVTAAVEADMQFYFLF